ncbi:glycosyltransferase family 4 protein [Lentisalinibacter orientalis]|uniref:glycosyltransferase family 4 protein n=1 Tax=Lentisalinibacter orientalis TaxID=2992241 RepID=UPI00386AD241
MDSDGISFQVMLIEQFFYPEGWSGAEIPRSIAIHLASRGIHVRALCGSDQYAFVKDQASENPEEYGVKIVRVPRLIRSAGIHRYKLLRQLWFYLASLPMLLFRSPPTVYVSQTNPPLMPAIVAAVALIHRRDFVLIAMDLYPEVMFAHGMARMDSLFGRFVSKLMGWAYGRATKVIALGPSMKERLLEKGVASDKVEIISNWATGDVDIVRGPANTLAAKWGLTDFPVILYSGNIGISHDISAPILAFEKALVSASALRLLFIGSGTRLQEAKSLVSQRGLEDRVQFRGLVPIDQLPESIGVASVALVTLNPGFEGLVVPSKLLGYMARGVPTVYIGPPSDVSHLIEVSGGGVVYSNDDTDGIARFFASIGDNPDALHTLGSNARRYYNAHLSKELGLSQYYDVICEAATAESRSRKV